MRWALLGLALGLAACGEKEPVTVTPPADTSVEAHRRAASARSQYQELGQTHRLGRAGGKAWNEAEDARTNKQFDAATASYDIATRSYAVATTSIKQTQALRLEKTYREAIDAQAVAFATRTQLDTLRANLVSRVTAAPEGERELYARVVKYCNQEIFTNNALLEIDAKLETGKALFADERYEQASKSYVEAVAALQKIWPLCAKAELRFRALESQERAQSAAAGTRKAFERRQLAMSLIPAQGADAIAWGNRKLAAKEYEAAIEAYEDATRVYNAAREGARALRRKRLEFAQAWKTADAAKKRWQEYARGEGIDATQPAKSADALVARAGALGEKGDYAGATKWLKQALDAYTDLRRATVKRLDDALKAKQKGPAPEPLGKFTFKAFRKPVAAALAWLAAHQDEEGRWNSDQFMKHDPADDKCDGPGGALYDAGVSGLALLAFLDAGFSDRGDGAAAYYAINIRRGLRYLLSVQDEEGVYGTRASTHFMYCTCIAAQAVARAYERTKDVRYGKSAQLAMTWIGKARNDDFGWQYAPRDGKTDTSVTYWAIEALATGRRAGLIVDKQAFKGALRWVREMTSMWGTIGYRTKRGGRSSRLEGTEKQFPLYLTKAMTAAGLTIRLRCGEPVDTSFREGLQRIASTEPRWYRDEVRGVDMYYWHAALRLLAHPKVNKWHKARLIRSDWQKLILRHVVAHQRKGIAGSVTGSWDPVGAWGKAGGRVYATAILARALCAGANE